MGFSHSPVFTDVFMETFEKIVVTNPKLGFGKLAISSTFRLMAAKGVYSISCSCGAVFIGETRCSKKTRSYEHQIFRSS